MPAVPDLAEQVAVGANGDQVQREEHPVELRKRGDQAEQQRQACQDREPEQTPGLLLRALGRTDAYRHVEESLPETPPPRPRGRCLTPPTGSRRLRRI